MYTWDKKGHACKVLIDNPGERDQQEYLNIDGRIFKWILEEGRFWTGFV
jgi:hypothetical protein